MLTELKPFELEIISKFKTFSPIVGGGKSVPRKGVWVRSHLLEAGDKGDFVYSMWQRWSGFVVRAREREAFIEIGTYTAFRTYIYLLKKDGLITPTRRERAKTTRREFYRQYYRVNTRRLEDPRWLNPYGIYESWQRRKAEGFPRPKKKPKPPKIPVVPPPYPWLSPEELDRIWAEAERFLTEHRYTITREDLEQIVPGWGMEAAAYPTFKERVGYVIHEAVEIEEVSLVARRLIDPRLAPEPVATRAHKIAERMEREWLKRVS